MTANHHVLLGRPGRLLRLAALGIVAFATASGFLAVDAYTTQVDRAVQESAIRARGAAADVDRYVASRWSALSPIAAVDPVRAGDADGIRRYLSGLDVGEMGFDAGIGYIDRQGMQTARSGGYTGPPIDFRDRDHIRRALETGRPTVSSAFLGAVNPSPLVAFAVPVRDDAGRVTGLIGGGIRLDATSIGSDSLRFAGGSAVEILDANGLMIAGPEPVTRLVDAAPAFPVDAMRAAGEGAEASAIGPRGEPDRLIGFAMAPTAGWLVLVERSAEEAFGPARTALAAQLLALTLGAAIAVLLLIWAGKRLDAAAVAERRNLAALQDAVGQLEHRQALRDAFVGVMSHELRTPVTTIYGAVKLLVKWPRRPDLESLLSDIEEEADRLQRITEDLLVLSRAEHGLVEVRPEPVLLQRLVAGIVADVTRRFPSATIRHEIPAELPPLAADPGAVRQVLDNLLANAAKYGGGTPIELTARQVDADARIEVADTGPGLPPGEHDRIFELFYRSPSNERRASGTGIGLFVVRQLVEAMGGTVTAEPVRPRGLRFVIRLPFDPAHAVDAPAFETDRAPAFEVASAG